MEARSVFEIRLWRQDTKLLEAQTIPGAERTGPAEDKRLNAEVGETIIRAATDPYALQAPKAEVLPPQELRLGPRRDAIAIDQHGVPQLTHSLPAREGSASAPQHTALPRERQPAYGAAPCVSPRP